MKKEQVGIVGSGQVGASLATLLIGNGYPAVMLCTSASRFEPAIRTVRENFESLESVGLVTSEQTNRCIKLLSTVDSYSELSQVSFVFEAVYENAEVKRDVYRLLEDCLPGDAVIASATSAMSAEVLGEMFRRPERFLVAHPWNPPHLVPLVEVCSSKHTSRAAIDTTIELLESLGRKVVVLSRDIEGFIGNRLMHAMFREALYMIEQGVCTAEDINTAVYYSFGQRYSSIGLLEHYDYAGLNLQHDVQSNLLPTLCNETGPQKVLLDCLQRGEIGTTSGKGVLDWSGVDMQDFNNRRYKPFYQFFNWTLP